MQLDYMDEDFNFVFMHNVLTVSLVAFNIILPKEGYTIILGLCAKN